VRLDNEDQMLSRSEPDPRVHARQRNDTVSIESAATGGPVAVRCDQVHGPQGTPNSGLRALHEPTVGLTSTSAMDSDRAEPVPTGEFRVPVHGF
jgi:hypothetical protein